MATDVRAVVGSVLQLVGQELEARARLVLVLELRETGTVAAHPSRLMQVVLNLVMNAMQSLPPAPARAHQISIATRIRGDQVVIEVGDSGPGVPAAQRERIFEPFVTTKPIGEGTGLGLFVCRNIVRGYAGEVSVHDRPEGGALFRVTLQQLLGWPPPWERHRSSKRSPRARPTCSSSMMTSRWRRPSPDNCSGRATAQAPARAALWACNEC